MTQPESSRFVFSMRGPNEDLNQFVSLIFLKSAYSYPLLLTLTKDITIGLGPLFHVIVSQSPIFFSLDDLADQLLYCSLNGWFVLSWRMMLNPARPRRPASLLLPQRLVRSLLAHDAESSGHQGAQGRFDAGFEVDRPGFAGRDCDCGVFDVPTVR